MNSEKIYRTRDGTRVRIAKRRQHPIHGGDPSWLQDIHRRENERLVAVRLKDGHVLDGVDLNTLVEEKP